MAAKAKSNPEEKVKLVVPKRIQKEMDDAKKTPKKKHPGGRPPRSDRAELLELFKAYVQKTAYPIVTEFTSKHGILQSQIYEWEEFSDTIKRAADKKLAFLEHELVWRPNGNITGLIFALKNHHGWKDESSVNLTAKVFLVGPEDKKMV